ncbi:MAG: ATP:cob(I)alamin adenosyltransferase [Caulobacteraceae bacterium]|jgi:cob(I)alamin adenosyltransferase|nr:ATP:cob(I)alamin adenosyltransferase [Caulobacteraceae bacterium]
MVLLNKIYTRAGDGGKTRLVTGETVAKTDPRVEAYGVVDELNAVLGLVRLETAADAVLDPILARIQNDLFDLGADLATPDLGGAAALRIVDAQVERLEGEIDRLNAGLAPLTSFVLPGGSRAAAALHLARTVCRRAERRAVAFAHALSPEAAAAHGPALRYLNRLSDLLFVASRHANAGGAGDILWVPAANR